MLDFLVSTRDSRYWSTAVRYAAQFAARCDGSLTAVYVVPPPLVVPEACSLSFATELLAIEREEAAAARHAQVPFARWTRELGVARGNWRVAEGNESSVLQSAAKWCDVLLLDRPGTPSAVSLGTLGEVVLRAGVPCIVVPPRITAATFATAAVAWKGTAESARALHAALPFLGRFERIVVIYGERGTSIEAIEASAQSAAQHLREHGLQPALKRIDPEPQEAGEAIFAAASAESAGLVVMGAYGRSRFSEWVFGGATRHALEAAAIPVFLRH